MKLFLTALFFIAFSFTAIAQEDYKKEIQLEFEAYMNSFAEGNFDKALSYIIDDFFELFPKQMMTEMLEASFNSDFAKMEIKDHQIMELRDSVKIDSAIYVRMRYSTSFSMQILQQEGESDEDHKTMMEFMKTTFAETYGEEKVNYLEEEDIFLVKEEKDMYAIKKSGYTNWKFLAVEKEQMAILGQLLPKQLIDQH